MDGWRAWSAGSVVGEVVLAVGDGVVWLVDGRGSVDGRLVVMIGGVVAGLVRGADVSWFERSEVWFGGEVLVLALLVVGSMGEYMSESDELVVSWRCRRPAWACGGSGDVSWAGAGFSSMSDSSAV